MVELSTKSKLIGLRKMANLTQKQIARLLNMNRATYNKKENNPNLFTFEEQKKIRTILNNELKIGLEIFS